MVKAVRVLVGAELLAASVAGHAYTPGAGLSGTPHDWSTGDGATVLLWKDGRGGATSYNTGTPWVDPATNRQGTTRIANGRCATCHTPQQAGSATLLWNYTLQAVGYRWNDPATTAGTRYPAFQGDTYKGPTTKCLSCHDGLLASGYAVSQGGNLSHTHPVAMPYPINGAPNTYNAVRNGAQIATSEWVGDPMATNGIRLFNDDGSGNIVVGVVPGRTGIECSSCHDAHNGSRVRDQMFLTGLIGSRDRGAGGYLCNQCHLK